MMLVAALACTSPPGHAQLAPLPSAPLYDPDSAHIWNRVDRHLRVRVTKDGLSHGADAVDPLLWHSTQYLLTPPSHAHALALLDEFLNTGADRLVTDPLKRAVFQRDLWAVFDWAVSTFETNADARRPLAARLARMIRRVALTPKQIASLPDPYAAAVVARRYPATYDAAQRARAFLPPDLFDSKGPWIPIHGGVPVAQHSDELSRSSFRVFLSLPGERAATLAYLKKLWEAPDPFVIDHPSSFGGEQRTIINPALHALPVGTRIALVRKMLLVDANGEIRQTNLVESVQMRVFRSAEPLDPARLMFGGRNDQDFYEFVLTRPGLFSNAALGLRPLAPDEEGFLTFSSHGIDPFEHQPVSTSRLGRPLEGCVACHHAAGLASVLTARRLFKPYTFSEAGGPGGDGMPEFWKSRRADWGWLQSLWRLE
ncbi:MAG TPA: hypothetical protein VJ813_02345 [Vicinamibacterales bacterium]|nr:hypothetical protein [Vicinamibacterales bacterium]